MIATRDTELGLDTVAPLDGPVADRRAPILRRGIVLPAVGLAYAAINVWAAAVADDPFRWWANFIVLPGLTLLALAAGLPRVARETRFVLAWIGSVILAVGLLLFGHAMGALWPVMIIVPCLGPLGLVALRPSDPSVRAFVNTIAGLAAVAISLGVAFLLIHAGSIDLDGVRWWAWFMLAAAAVPVLNGLVLLADRRGTYWFSMAVLLIALGGYTALAAFAELNR